MSKKEEMKETKKTSEGKTTLLVNKWIEDNLVDDIEENYDIANLAIVNVAKKFSAHFKTPELVLAFYGKTFDTIMDVLNENRGKHSNFCINMCDRFEIGYTDAEHDEDAEKIGSFVPFIYDCSSGKKTYDNKENLRTLDVCTSWLSQNCIKQPEIIKTIGSRALKVLGDDICLYLAEQEIVIPIFIIIHESMIGYLTLKLAESDKRRIKINFAGCFDVNVSLDENNNTLIEYSPTIAAKLSTKSDSIATSKYE